jgi:hypothetical protein
MRVKTNTNLLCLHQMIFESQYYINTVGDVDWVCLATERMVMSLQVV